MTPQDPVLAAGGVLCRGDGPDLEVALVHRPRYDDWSLPKGKRDPGEHLVVTARREVAEETGHLAVCGRPLGEQRYLVEGRDGQPQDKVVHYWAMRDGQGVFTPHGEIDQMRWLPPTEAARTLTHPRDREQLDRLAGGPVRTTTVLLVRHGRAGSKRSWPGEDLLRPLDSKGRRQSERLRQVAPCFGPIRVVSARPVRCVETVRPLAADLGCPVEVDPAFDETVAIAEPELAVRRLRALAAEGA
ncbi:MAG TPA: bifunctional NUDIX hydrolase/histidine phosphatase family protein, partial [Frankiaceae bacterium]|nr:bifunctional NUDIX hydrolase/histidine phosphatase family protein [Frankiaceae bacterium]